MTGGTLGTHADPDQPPRPCPLCGRLVHPSKEELAREVRRETIRSVAEVAGMFLLLIGIIVAVAVASGDLP